MDNIITILMSTYNGERYLDEQLKSIEDQKVDSNISIKVLVRDDGSKDSTLNILEAWKDKLNLQIIKGENKGVSDSFNELIFSAPDSDYYAFADQDDVWNQDKIQTAIDILKRDETLRKPRLYFSNASLVDESLNSLNRNVHTDNIEINLSKIMICNPALGCTMVFNKEALDMMKKADIKNSPMHDKTALIVSFLTGEVYYDNEPRMLYRQHSNNVMGRGTSIKKRIRQIYKLWIKSDDCSIEKYSNELLNKMISQMSQENIDILSIFANYKKKLNYRFKIVFNKNMSTGKHRIDRSFKIRILLGLA